MNDKFHLSKNKYSNWFIKLIKRKQVKVNDYLGNKLINNKNNYEKNNLNHKKKISEKQIN